MRHLLRKLFDIREGEGLRAGLMFSYIFLIIASLLIVKPVRNSLFLTAFGANSLPYAFILVAVFSGVFIYVYSKFSGKFRLNILILYTIITSIAIFGIFWFLLVLDYKGDWFLYVFYVWVAIFGVVLTMQFWLLANYVFNSREAKRLFGFVGAGAIAGGIFGGYLTNYLAPLIGTGNMLLVCIGFLTACTFLLKAIWVKSARQNYKEKIKQQERIQQTKGPENPLRLIFRSRHLAYLAGIVGIGVIVANLVDYQYSAVASAAITNEDNLTAFFGFWLSNLSIVSLGIQLFLTRKVLQTLGVGNSLFFLPLGILAGAIFVLINPILWAAIFIKVSDGGLKQSINKAGLELLYLPIPAAIKNQAKAFIDVFVDNLATGLGGLLLVVLIVGSRLSIGHVSLMIIGLIAIWIYLIIQMRREYVNSFRLAIEKKTINIEEEAVNFEDASVFENIIGMLNSNNERQILYGLRFLEGLKKEEFLPHLQRLLDFNSTDIKMKVLQILRDYKSDDLIPRVDALLRDDSQKVRVEAMHYLLKHSEDKIQTIYQALNESDYHIQSSAIIAAARELRENKDLREHIDLKALFESRLRKYFSSEDSEKAQFMKIGAAEVIGISDNAELYPYLQELLNDKSTRVLEAAIINAGRTGSIDFVPVLIDHLNTKFVRQSVREALAEYGENIIDELRTRMNDPKQPANVRLGIPKVLALIGSQESVNVLIDNLRQDDLALRYQTLKALNKLKVKFPVLKFDENRINKNIVEETRNYYRILTIIYEQNRMGNVADDEKEINGKTHMSDEARRLLVRALEEKLDDNLERIFRLLGLKYLQKDMYNAYQGIRSNKSDLRANAVEFLDNVLNFDLKRFIIPIVESDSYSNLIDKSQEFFGFKIQDERDCLTMLLKGDDDWLKSCALYLLAALNNDDCVDLITQMSQNPNPIVRETAGFALDRLRAVN